MDEPQAMITRGIGIDIGRPESESSGMRRFRVTLLPYNDAFKERASQIRKVLGIPETGVPDVNLSSSPDREWSRVDKLYTENLWVMWYDVHSAKARGESYDLPQLPNNMPDWYLQSLASERCIACRDEEVPAWLTVPTNLDFLEVDADPIGRFDPRVPLDRFVGCLIQCFGLPRLIFRDVRLYIWTNNLDDIPCPGAFDVRIYRLLTNLGLECGITVEGIDHYSTKEQWLEVWEKYVRPKVESVWTLRGQTPSYRKADKTWEHYKELYILRVIGDRTVDETLRVYQDLHGESPVENTVYTATKFIKDMMKPRD